MDTNEIKKENKSKKVLVFLICIIGIAMICKRIIKIFWFL